MAVPCGVNVRSLSVDRVAYKTTQEELSQSSLTEVSRFPRGFLAACRPKKPVANAWYTTELRCRVGFIPRAHSLGARAETPRSEPL